MEKNGLILVDKAYDLSSFSVVKLLRQILRIKRVGHVGTLDPFATGLLPVAFGRGTASIQYMEHFTKRYQVLGCLGERRDSMDLTGSVIASYPGAGSGQTVEKVSPSQTPPLLDLYRQGVLAERLEVACAKLEGDLQQLPPMYSALKYQGKPLYEYARQGRDIARRPRPVKIEILSCALLLADQVEAFLQAQRYPFSRPLPSHGEIFVFADLRVSKGTYIRSWMDELGELLGTHAYCESLRRLEVGPFSLDQRSFTCPQLRTLLDDAEAWQTLLNTGNVLGLEAAFPRHPSLSFPEDLARRLVFGQTIPFRQLPSDLQEELIHMRGYECLAFYEGKFIALVDVHRDPDISLKSKRVFVSHEDI